jgi:hypothetical protein
MNIRFLGKIGSVHGGSGGQLIGGDVGHDDFIAPRRRTEPAITVPPTRAPSAYGFDMACVGDRIRFWLDDGTMSSEVIECFKGDVALTRSLDSRRAARVHRSLFDAQSVYLLGTAPVEAFAPSEVEQCKLHGAGAYESMAADIAQVRELARAAWVRSLPVWQPDETCGDYAHRAGILPPKPGKREQWEDSVWLAAAERMAMEMSNE